MAYVSLYRKYRPQTFDDVVGQTHVTRTLANAIAEDRLHHAYLFTGPRGTGKTSTARILAKAINCEQGPTASPCNTCRQCEEITDGSSVDVIELDMASHGGVDDARELRDRALFAPASARRKVYILDEVHMASTAAFNALLKLIEEPPAHVMFAMATTDPQKVLPTIMSRVQRLDLRRVSAADVAGNVRELCELEGYRIEDGAVEAVVRAGDGSLRDTQSVLEQVLAFAGNEVTTEAVAQVLGQTPVQRVIEVVDLLAARDVAGLLAAVQGLVDEGHDLRRFTLDLVQHVRDLLVMGAAPDRPDLVDATEERRSRLATQAATLPAETLLRAVTVLAATVTEQRLGSPRLPLELALATLVVPNEEVQLAELSDRLARLEAAAAPGSAAAPDPTVASRPAAAPDPSPAAEPGPVPEPDASEPASPNGLAATDVASVEADGPAEAAKSSAPVPAVPEPTTEASDPGSAPTASGSTADELALITGHWDAILEKVRSGSRRHHAIFEPATPTRAGRGILTLRYGRRYASFHAANAGTGDYADALQRAIAEVCGLKMRLEILIEGEDDRRRPLPPSLTPDDARTPVLNADADEAATSTSPPTPDVSPAEPLAEPASIDDGTAVREAESDAPGEADPEEVGRLLADELGAELIDHRPPPEDPEA